MKSRPWRQEAPFRPLKSAYPNPASDVVNIVCMEPAAVHLYNLCGELLLTDNIVQRSTINKNLLPLRINISDFTPGIYFIRADFEEGYAVEKLVVSK